MSKPTMASVVRAMAKSAEHRSRRLKAQAWRLVYHNQNNNP